VVERPLSLFDWQNTSFEVKDGKPEVAVLPVGTTEPCGDHLPVGATAIVLDVLTRRVAERLPWTTYLLPTLPWGTSGLHMGRPGAVALEWPTLMHVLRDLVESLLAQGIRKVLVLNGIGGVTATRVRPRENTIVKATVRQLNYDFPDLDAVWVQPFTAAGQELEEIIESAREDVHAGELVTSLLLHLAPETVKGKGDDWAPGVETGYLDYIAFEQLCPGGVWGRPSLASADKGRRALDLAVQRTVEYAMTTFAQLATLKHRA
jgi:creatinine amidohydrolase